MEPFYKCSIPDKNKIEKVEMSNEELTNFIEKNTWYQRFDFGNGIIAKATHNSAEEVDIVLPKDMNGMRYLDIGFNQGFYLMTGAVRGADSYGIDKAKKQYNQANTIAKHFGIKINTFIGDILEADKKYSEYANGFDFISMMSMFHHLKKPKEALRIVRGMSKGVMMGEFVCWIEGEKRWGKATEFPDDWGKDYHKVYPTLDCVLTELRKLYRNVTVLGPLKAKHRFLIKSEV
jgi:ubiquinone/menaquinone biosynthesis C-methylase UbiE